MRQYTLRVDATAWRINLRASSEAEVQHRLGKVDQFRRRLPSSERVLDLVLKLPRLSLEHDRAKEAASACRDEHLMAFSQEERRLSPSPLLEATATWLLERALRVAPYVSVRGADVPGPLEEKPTAVPSGSFPRGRMG